MAVPELDFENKKINQKNQVKINEKERAAVTFKAGDVGFRITMFFHYLHQAIEKATGKKNLTEFAKLLDSNHGCLSTQQENSFQ